MVLSRSRPSQRFRLAARTRTANSAPAAGQLLIKDWQPERPESLTGVTGPPFSRPAEEEGLAGELAARRMVNGRRIFCR
jgi:hypothetical protein